MSAMVLSSVLSGAALSLLLAAFTWCVFKFCGIRFWNASTRYAVWLLVLAVTVALPVIYGGIQWTQEMASGAEDLPGAMLWRPGSGSATAVGPKDISSPHVAAAGTSQDILLPTLRIPGGLWAGWILGAWTLGTAFMLLRLVAGYRWLHQRKTQASPTPLAARTVAWMKHGGSARRIGVAVSEDVATPVAAGPFRPLILMPARLIDRLDSEQIEQIGLHEAAHFARWDDYTLLFQRVMEAVFVFHPVVHWIGRRLDIERELACDDVVVASTGRARLYAECLTRVAELASGLAVPSVAAPAVEIRSVLERRLDMLLDKNRRSNTHLSRLRLAVATALLAVAVGIAAAGPQLVAFATPAGTAGAPAAASPPLRQPLPGVIAPQNQDRDRADATDNLNRGIEAFESRDYQVAVNYFGRATQLNPELTLAQLYLATAYAALYVPQMPETRDYSNRAIVILEGVLAREPSNVDALGGLALIYQNRKEFRTARDFFLKAAEFAPRHTALLYSIGAVDWLIVYDKTNPPSLNEKSLLIDEGLQHLDRALAVMTFVEAMTYKNLLLREKAKLASDPAERDNLVAQADEWFNKTLVELKQNGTRPMQPISIVGLGTSAAMPPPPPPPLPPPAGGRGGPGQARGGTIGAIGGPGPAPAQSPAPPVRVGGDVAARNLVYQVKPVYPPLARAAGVLDYVLTQAVIAKDGTVQSVQVIRGHPLLNDAATAAVKQWRYKPLALNGQTVEAITTVTVNFSLE